MPARDRSRLNSLAFSVKILLACICSVFSGALIAGQIVDADVCVYGATPAGITAAIQARRMGRTSVICEPGTHIGGMTSGGLGATDIGNKAAIGGLAREFYHRVAQYYSRDESWPLERREDYFANHLASSRRSDLDSPDATMWMFEPHVAEKIFTNMLLEARVPLYPGHRLASVGKSGTALTEIVMEDGAVFHARMFVDATYEGDLMAKAGVHYAIGRESNSKYGEALNGIRANTPKHQFTASVDPYVRRGDPTSGLLPFIQNEPLGTPGAGDRSVQAYNFRLCYTRDPRNRLPNTPPSNYDPRQFELLARYLEAGIAAGRKPQLKDLWNPIWLPNGKTDINNNGGFSTDFIGANFRYPEGTYAERQQLWLQHKDYTQGFIYFLATSPRVPAEIRSEMQSWGPAKDEFADNNHWPSQLYVREARRMISDYVMTEHNCRGTTRAADPAGLAAYTMDSHNCRRIVTNRIAQNEGDVQVGGFPPYPISYRSIVPKAGECDNLFVPVCLSATHIAYGSIRMEPVFMILGQTAGTAAALAIDARRGVQAIDYQILHARLLADNQVLEWKPAAADTAFPLADLSSMKGILLDDVEGIKTGAWANSASPEKRRVGNGYIHDNNTNKGQSTITFTPEIPKAGEYEIFLIFPPHPNRAGKVPLKITVVGLPGDSVYEQTRFVDERKTDTGGLSSLGRFYLPKGRKTSVTVSNKDTKGYVVVDGMQFVPQF